MDALSLALGLFLPWVPGACPTEESLWLGFLILSRDCCSELSGLLPGEIWEAGDLHPGSGCASAFM